jgi:hypothetical protein
MRTQVIDSKNFDQNFKKLLEEKKGQNVVVGRFNIDPVTLEAKSGFVIHLLSSFKLIRGFVYKILFWEDDELVEKFLKDRFENKEYTKVFGYKKRETPGVIFLEDEMLDVFFLEQLLITHFNFEMAKEPALNMRVQICINRDNSPILLDIYDDRGFDVYFINENLW